MYKITDISDIFHLWQLFAGYLLNLLLRWAKLRIYWVLIWIRSAEIDVSLKDFMAVKTWLATVLIQCIVTRLALWCVLLGVMHRPILPLFFRIPSPAQGVILWLPQCRWINSEEYGPIKYMNHWELLIYHQTSNISRIKSQNLNVSRLVLQLSLPNPLKPGVKSRMKM